MIDLDKVKQHHLDGNEIPEKYRNTGAESIVRSLLRHNITTIFAQSIPTSMILCATKMGIRQIDYRTENAGGIMADGFARVSGKITVVTAQNGPAATLLVPPLAEALKASTPILAIVQDVSEADIDKNAFQELDQLELFKGVAKWVKRVNSVSRIDDYIDMAIMAATSGRPGPSVLLIPKNILYEKCDLQEIVRKEVLGHYPLDRFVPDTNKLEKAISLLLNAKNPLIVAGGGVISSGAENELEHLMRIVNVPVATTVMGKGAVSENEILAMGVLAYFNARGGVGFYFKDYIDKADVVFFIGTRTNQNGTDSWNLYPDNATYIHLDIDGEEISRNYESVRLLGDVKATLELMIDIIEESRLTNDSNNHANIESQFRDAKAQFDFDYKEIAELKVEKLRPESIMREINQALSENIIIVTDASYAAVWVANYLTCKNTKQRFVFPRGLAGLGWGLPLSIGAKVGAPNKKVVCITGDGGFAHCWSELLTLKAHRIQIILIILNNSVLGFQKHAEAAKYHTYSNACDISTVDYVKLGEACGIKGRRVEEINDFSKAFKNALESEESTIIDVIVDENAYPPLTGYDKIYGWLPDIVHEKIE